MFALIQFQMLNDVNCVRYYNLLFYHVKSLAFYPSIFEIDLSSSDFFEEFFFLAAFSFSHEFIRCISLMNLIKDGTFFVSNFVTVKSMTLQRICDRTKIMRSKFCNRIHVEKAIFCSSFFSLCDCFTSLYASIVWAVHTNEIIVRRLKHFGKYVTKCHWQKAYIFQRVKEPDRYNGWNWYYA